jgi:hypothetical protein
MSALIASTGTSLVSSMDSRETNQPSALLAASNSALPWLWPRGVKQKIATPSLARRIGVSRFQARSACGLMAYSDKMTTCGPMPT